MVADPADYEAALDDAPPAGVASILQEDVVPIWNPTTKQVLIRRYRHYILIVISISYHVICIYYILYTVIQLYRYTA